MRKLFLFSMCFVSFLAVVAKGDSTTRSFRIINLNTVPTVLARGYAYEVGFTNVWRKMTLGAELGGIMKPFTSDKTMPNKYEGFYGKVLIGKRIGLGYHQKDIIKRGFLHLAAGIAYSTWTEEHKETFKGSVYGDREFIYPQKTRTLITVPARFGFNLYPGAFIDISTGAEVNIHIQNEGKNETFPSRYLPGAGLDLSGNVEQAAPYATMRYYFCLGFRFR